MKIDQLIEQFITVQKAHGKAENTLKNYKTDLICFAEYIIERRSDQQLSNFTLDNTIQYGQYLSHRFTSDNSRRRRVQTLRIFFDFLTQQEIIKENFARKIPVSPKFLDIPKPTPHADMFKVWAFLTQERSLTTELEELIVLRNQLLFLLIYTGALKVTHISNLSFSQLTTGNNPRVLLFPKKGDPYTVPLHRTFSSILLRYKDLLKKQQHKDQIEFEEVFFYANPHKLISGGISPRGIELIFKDIRTKLGISNLTPKSMRIATIFAWIHARNSEETIKHWLGVAPSYSLGPYLKTKDHNIHNFSFL